VFLSRLWDYVLVVDVANCGERAQEGEERFVSLGGAARDCRHRIG
jgi:hypothetical protein